MLVLLAKYQTILLVLNEDGLKEKCKVFYSKKELLPTGKCLILITPDSERTMCTFLGTREK